MQLNQLKPIHKLKKRKRVGRGGKRGSYSGKGIKGQRSRAGRKFQPAIRELIKRYPKLKGYRFEKRINEITVVNVGGLEKKFNKGEIVNPRTLFEKRLIRRIKGKVPKVKILAKGELTKALIIQDCQVSKTAREIIEKAGGVIS